MEDGTRRDGGGGQGGHSVPAPCLSTDMFLDTELHLAILHGEILHIL